MLGSEWLLEWIMMNRMIQIRFSGEIFEMFWVKL
jgi:hypothetical protein